MPRTVVRGVTASPSAVGTSSLRMTRWLIARSKLVLTLNQRPQEHLPDSYFFFNFSFCLFTQCFCRFLLFMLKNHVSSPKKSFYTFLFIFIASCFHLIDVIKFPLFKVMN